MSARLIEIPRSPRKGSMALLAALAATVATLVGLTAAPVSSASSIGWCSGVTLGPSGQCHMPHAQAGDYVAVNAHGHERAACVAPLGYYGEQIDSWVCAPAYTSAWYYMPAWRPFGYYRAAVKNNNTKQSGHFQGNVFCCRQ